MIAKIPWQRDVRDWPCRLSELEIDHSRTGLLIVDMQKDTALPTKVLPNNIRLLEFFRRHGLRVCFCCVGNFLPDGRDSHIKRRLTWNRVTADEPPKGRFREEERYQVCNEIKPLPGEPIFAKNPGSVFSSSAIDSYLRAWGTQNLVVSGVVTSRCVENSARDAADKGYNVILVHDACNDKEPENHKSCVRTFGRVLGAVKTTDEVISEFSSLLNGDRSQEGLR